MESSYSRSIPKQSDPKLSPQSDTLNTLNTLNTIDPPSALLLTLDQVQARFQQWRSIRKRCTPIPEALLDDAFTLVGRYRQTDILKKLNINPIRFKQVLLSKTQTNKQSESTEPEQREPEPRTKKSVEPKPIKSESKDQERSNPIPSPDFIPFILPHFFSHPNPKEVDQGMDPRGAASRVDQRTNPKPDVPCTDQGFYNQRPEKQKANTAIIAEVRHPSGTIVRFEALTDHQFRALVQTFIGPPVTSNHGTINHRHY